MCQTIAAWLHVSAWHPRIESPFQSDDASTIDPSSAVRSLSLWECQKCSSHVRDRIPYLPLRNHSKCSLYSAVKSSSTVDHKSFERDFRCRQQRPVHVSFNRMGRLCSIQGDNSSFAAAYVCSLHHHPEIGISTKLSFDHFTFWNHLINIFREYVSDCHAASS